MGKQIVDCLLIFHDKCICEVVSNQDFILFLRKNPSKQAFYAFLSNISILSNANTTTCLQYFTGCFIPKCPNSICLILEILHVFRYFSQPNSISETHFGLIIASYAQFQRQGLKMEHPAIKLSYLYIQVARMNFCLEKYTIDNCCVSHLHFDIFFF